MCDGNGYVGFFIVMHLLLQTMSHVLSMKRRMNLSSIYYNESFTRITGIN
jgi:hypothetical protein